MQNCGLGAINFKGDIAWWSLDFGELRSKLRFEDSCVYVVKSSRFYRNEKAWTLEASNVAWISTLICTGCSWSSCCIFLGCFLICRLGKVMLLHRIIERIRYLKLRNSFSSRLTISNYDQNIFWISQSHFYIKAKTWFCELFSRIFSFSTNGTNNLLSQKSESPSTF